MVGLQEIVTFLKPMLFLATLGTTLLMGRFLLATAHHGPDAKKVEISINLSLWLPWLFLLGLSATLPWFWLLYAFPDEAVAWIGAVWSIEVLLKALSPLLLCGFFVGMVIRRPRPRASAFGTALLTGQRIWRRQQERCLRRWWRQQQTTALHFERRLQQWPMAGRALILLAALLGTSLLVAR